MTVERSQRAALIRELAAIGYTGATLRKLVRQRERLEATRQQLPRQERPPENETPEQHLLRVHADFSWSQLTGRAFERAPALLPARPDRPPPGTDPTAEPWTNRSLPLAAPARDGPRAARSIRAVDL